MRKASIEGARTLNPRVSIPKRRLVTFCRGHGIKRLAIFGSALRPDFGSHSDIDVLVEFDTQARRTLRDMARMQDELSRILRRRVDLVERTAVEASRNYIRRDAILRSAETVYAA